MSLKQVEVKGKTYWRMYVCERAKLPGGKVKKLQKNLLFELNEKQTAENEEKKWKRNLAKEAARLEDRDLEFGDILHRYKVQAEAGFIGQKLEPQTLQDHINRIKRFCGSWMQEVSSDLTRGDGRQVLRHANLVHGASVTLQRKLKTSINKVFVWGIEEKLIAGVHLSPVYGLHIEEDDDEEKIPPILTLEQVRQLLTKAQEVNHPWYPVWAFGVLTGMRSGELFALKWSAVDLENRIIRVYQSYHWRKKKAKSTKAGYWRNVPISDHLLALILELKRENGHSEFVLPRVQGWEDGYAAKNLRLFLHGHGIHDGSTHVVFHTLRACFATHLLASGAEPAKVMLIGGWKDLKTFQIYIRLAGVDVLGVTDKLNPLPPEVRVKIENIQEDLKELRENKKILPSERAIVDHVKDIYNMAA